MKKDYNEFKKLLSFYGFPNNEILSLEQYIDGKNKGLTDGQLYSIACDVNSGFDFEIPAQQGTAL